MNLKSIHKYAENMLLNNILLDTFLFKDIDMNKNGLVRNKVPEAYCVIAGSVFVVSAFNKYFKYVIQTLVIENTFGPDRCSMQTYKISYFTTSVPS